MKLFKWLDNHLEEFILVIFLVAITLVTFVQVIVRKIPWIPSFTWAEEFCRFVWIWSVFLSLPYTIKNRNMLRVTVLLDILPQFLRKTLDIIVDIVTIACMALFFCYSIPLVRDRFTSGETSPAMLWPMWAIYVSMSIGFILGAIRGVETLFYHIKHFGERQLSTTEQAEADARAEIEAAQGAEGIGGEA